MASRALFVHEDLIARLFPPADSKWPAVLQATRDQGLIGSHETGFDAGGNPSRCD